MRAHGGYYLVVQVLDELRDFLLQALRGVVDALADARRCAFDFAVEVVHGTPRDVA
jgi:hypothetical protein